MTTPIDPKMCTVSGRLLTEWFEFPEYTPETLYADACEANGTTPEEAPTGWITDIDPEEQDLARRINAFVAKRKNTTFVGGMSKQEVQHRLNEATKMVDPDNFKFLDEATRERTGLEINPLWLMECMVRSGILNAKEQIAALKELAAYTHSKAPNVNLNANAEVKPEDWLLELAKEEYQVIDDVRPISHQPMQPVEKGAGKNYEKNMTKRIAETENLIAYGQEEMADMEAIVDAEWTEEDGS